MTAPHSISSDTTEALKLADDLEGLSQILTKENTGSDAGFDNICQRAAQLLRAPALPSGEVEPVAWQVEGPGGRWLHVHPVQMEEFRNVGRTLRPLFASSLTPQIAGDVREAPRKAKGRELNDIEGKLIQQALIDSGTPLYAIPQPQPVLPFSRWADIIESASLTISPEGSEALNALAAEVRSYA